MTFHAVIAWWELTLRPGVPGKHPVKALTVSAVEGGCSPPDGSRRGSRRGTLCYTGEFLFASLDRGGWWTEIADIIICPGQPGGPQVQGKRLAQVLGQHPGCAIATCGRSGWCVVAARDGTAARLILPGGRPARAAVRGAAAGPGSWKTLAAGAGLAHAWLVSGRPLAGLDGSRLRAAAPGRDGRQAWCGQAAGVPFWFRVVYDRPQAGGLPSSRARTWAASGTSAASSAPAAV